MSTLQSCPETSALRAAAFVDRDGVINEERDYVWRLQDFHLLPGAVAGLRRLQAAGYALVVVTNQAGIGRGLYTEADFQALSAHMRNHLAAEGVVLDGIYHCPHHPTAGQGDYRRACDCRKPRPGMLLQAAAELGLDPARSVLVGDKLSDIQAGRAAGLARCVLVTSGHAVSTGDRAAADAVCDGLEAAAAWLLQAAPAGPWRNGR
jgi:D-glycero-D-manno-heptose 1,7-bisphosphate phosphatase